jgi:hypothetical protein
VGRLRNKRPDPIHKWRIQVTHLTLPAIAAHIHSAVAGAAGPTAVPLSPPDASGNSSGCATSRAAEQVTSWCLGVVALPGVSGQTPTLHATKARSAPGGNSRVRPVFPKQCGS